MNGLKVRIPHNQIESLRQVPGVVQGAARKHLPHQDNAVSVPRISAPQAWAGVNGVHGENVKVGIIDTGIDYTHANFGGPGTTAAFDAAQAADTAAGRSRALLAPVAPKVKGGIDLVGDDYNANDSHPSVASAGSESARLQRPRQPRRRHPLPDSA